MRRIVIDTNCLLAILPTRSPYHSVWTEFLANKLEICVSNEVLMEYEEILSEKTSPSFADSSSSATPRRATKRKSPLRLPRRGGKGKERKNFFLNTNYH
jgi:predicted nucleic acid-binding protein